TLLEGGDKNDLELVRKKSLKLLEKNKEELTPHVKVPAKTTIRLTDYSYYYVEKETTLQQLEKDLKSHDDPAQLLKRNKKLPDGRENKDKKGLSQPDQPPEAVPRPNPAEELPAGAELKRPQKQWPSVVIFASLVLILGVVGVGLLNRQS